MVFMVSVKVRVSNRVFSVRIRVRVSNKVRLKLGLGCLVLRLERHFFWCSSPPPPPPPC